MKEQREQWKLRGDKRRSLVWIWEGMRLFELTVEPCALPIHPTTNWWRMRGHKSFIAFDRRPSPLVLKWIVKSLIIPPSQYGATDSNLWPGSNTTCRTVCLIDPSNDQLVKNKGTQIFYSIRSQTKPIGIGANCEIPHNNELVLFKGLIINPTTCGLNDKLVHLWT